MAVAAAEEVFAAFEIISPHVFHQFIYAHISLFVSDSYPQADIPGTDGGPDTGAAEKVIAEDLAAICGVILEPLEVQTAGAKEFLILGVLAEMQPEVNMVQVPGFTGIAPGGVALEA